MDNKPSIVEGMASKEPMAEEDCNTLVGRKSRKKVALIVAAIVLSAIIIFLIPIVLFSARDNEPMNSCPNNLRSIDGAISQYEAEHGIGVFPSTIDELVPTYLRTAPKEPSGGYYYFDTTITPPKAVCSKGHTY